MTKGDSIVDLATTSSRWLDRHLGTSRMAVYSRLAVALTIAWYHVFQMNSSTLESAFLRILGLVMAWVVAPDAESFERVSRRPLLQAAITLIYLAVPVFMTGLLIWLSIVSDESPRTRVGCFMIAIGFAFCAYKIYLYRRPAMTKRAP